MNRYVVPDETGGVVFRHLKHIGKWPKSLDDRIGDLTPPIAVEYLVMDRLLDTANELTNS